jgi:N6-L-threonylcarbamoyladenine synthase
MKILAIETSCDETAIALVGAKGGLLRPHFKIFKNFVASQIKIHQPFGGVVPNLAKREHIKNLPILLNELRLTSQETENINLVAATIGPGLEPCLWVGINFAKDLAKSWKKPLIGVSHSEGHLYSILLNSKSSILYPAVALVVSGGHTILLLMKGLAHYKKLGETRDDAAGECFDKVARLLKLPYPGGPEIEKMARYGNSKAINFPRPMINQKNYDFSFSGLKTAVLYYLRDYKNVKIKDVASAFQAAAFDVLISKTLKAAKEFKAKSILVSGGVASNNSLRNYLKSQIKNQKLKIKIIIPAKKFCTDNAGMIAAAAYVNYLRNKKHKLTAQGNLTLR